MLMRASDCYSITPTAVHRNGMVQRIGGVVAAFQDGYWGRDWTHVSLDPCLDPCLDPSIIYVRYTDSRAHHSFCHEINGAVLAAGAQVEE